ncbi:MAG: hypothetical protein R3310_15300, partial [Candidatus Competibacteraceae bacterium]|nr:hypothetical protein [Candidatus Competibacteraceae bacterium]
EVVGKNINPRLPFGPDAGRWKTLLTEVQMLMHSASINLKREAKGLPAANSVWFWGLGRLPDKATSPALGIYADESLARGLARLAASPLNPLPEDALQWREAAQGEDSALVVLDQIRYPVLEDDPFAWSESLAALERDWLAPLLELLGQGELKTLYLYGCDGWRFRIDAGDLKRFWRRLRPLPQYLGHEVS